MVESSGPFVDFLVGPHCVVGMCSAQSIHSFGLVWSMPWIETLSAFISVADSSIFTQMDEAGATVGSVAKFASAPPSLLILKSPAAMVGFALNDPGYEASCRAM